MIKRRLYTTAWPSSAPHVCFETEGAAPPRPPGTLTKPAARGDPSRRVGPAAPEPPLTFSSICRSCSSPAASSCSSSFSMAGVITAASVCSPISAPSGSATSGRLLAVIRGYLRSPPAVPRGRPSPRPPLPELRVGIAPPRPRSRARRLTARLARTKTARCPSRARGGAVLARSPLRPPGRARPSWLLAASGHRRGIAEERPGRALPVGMSCQGSWWRNSSCGCLWKGWMWHLVSWSS